MPAQWMRPTGSRSACPWATSAPGPATPTGPPRCQRLARPGGLEVLRRLARLRPEVVREGAERGVAALGRRAAVEAARLVAADEAEEHAGRAVLGRVVVGDVDRSVERDGGAVEALVAPERAVVDGGDLRQVALAQALGELVALDPAPAGRTRSARPSRAAR